MNEFTEIGDTLRIDIIGQRAGGERWLIDSIEFRLGPIHHEQRMREFAHGVHAIAEQRFREYLNEEARKFEESDQYKN